MKHMCGSLRAGESCFRDPYGPSKAKEAHKEVGILSHIGAKSGPHQGFCFRGDLLCRVIWLAACLHSHINVCPSCS